MPNVEYVRPELLAVLPQYEEIRDVLAGQVAVKARKELYLPMPSKSSVDTAQAKRNDKLRYDAYLRRAVFYNVARQTHAGLVGEVFANDVEINLPSILDAIVRDATGTGITLEQLSKDALGETVALSRAGLFVDYPETQEGATKADIDSGRIRATLTLYKSENIINWRTVDVGAETLLSLVVLREEYVYADDGFEPKLAYQYRVLRLEEVAGKMIYKVDLYKEATPSPITKSIKLKGNYDVKTTHTPVGSDGQTFDRIHFTFIGTENNDDVVGDPVFYDIASLNLAHYRNSADYEESCFINGQPTVVVTGINQQWYEDVMHNEIRLGSVGGIPLPTNATASLLQAAPNSLIKDAMDTKERQMVSLGARLVEAKSVQRTATEVSADVRVEKSVLSSSADNVSTAFRFALGICLKYMGGSDSEVGFALSTDFGLPEASIEDCNAAIKQWKDGAITFKEMRSVLRKGKFATEKDDAAKTEIDTEKTAELERMIAVGAANEPN